MKSACLQLYDSYWDAVKLHDFSSKAGIGALVALPKAHRCWSTSGVSHAEYA